MGIRGNRDASIRIGVSTCLLGQKVRFDAGHKHDRFLTDTLGRYFEFVPACPEVDVGMGVPREAIRLVGTPENPRLVGVRSETDWTDKMHTYARRKVRSLVEHRLSGYILKSKSPSCGMERVKVYHPSGGHADYKGVGLFAAELRRVYPHLPVEEEGRLNDHRLRDNFIVRVFAYHRLQDLFADRLNRGEVVAFHTAHKYLLMAHSPTHYKELGSLVAAIKRTPVAEFREQYGRLFMEGLALHATVKKNVNVLMHMLGYFKDHLDAGDKRYLLGVIDDYHRELVPLVVPVTLLKRLVEKYNEEYLAGQVYLSPHPKELMLRNHV